MKPILTILGVAFICWSPSAFAQTASKCTASSFTGFWEASDGPNAGARLLIKAAIPGVHHGREIGQADSNNQIYFDWIKVTGPAGTNTALRTNRLDVKGASKADGCTLSYQYRKDLINHADFDLHVVGEISHTKSNDVLKIKTAGLETTLIRKDSLWNSKISEMFSTQIQTKDGLQWSQPFSESMAAYTYTWQLPREKAQQFCSAAGGRLPSKEEFENLFAELGFQPTTYSYLNIQHQARSLNMWKATPKGLAYFKSFQGKELYSFWVAPILGSESLKLVADMSPRFGHTEDFRTTVPQKDLIGVFDGEDRKVWESTGQVDGLAVNGIICVK